jgi:dipeptidyl aminopeptidase/acylaminoacyl peptidase
VADLSDLAGGSGRDNGAGGLPSTDRAVRVAGGGEESVGQPMWLSEDELVFVSDRSGFWQPYFWSAGTPAEAVCDIEAEFHYPDWTLGQSTIAALGTSRLACRIERDGRDSVVLLDLDRSTGSRREAMEELDQPCVVVRALCVADGEVVISGATPTQASVIVGARPGAGWRMLKSPGVAALPIPDETVSTAASMEFETAGGVVAQLNFYAPSGRTEDGSPISGPPGERPPVVVQCHGGPTGSAESGFDPVVQFWTTRGFAVASVNYRGSAGRGRQFRKLLDGNYGVADAEDCLAAADYLSRLGLVDEERALVRGGSSAGLTALRASSLGTIFAGALVTCGVTDLRVLATDTHKFESGYLEGLVGPYPDESLRYEERSPACRPELINAAVLLLHGEDDAVVPPAQAASLAEAIRAGGGRCEHVVFAGEGHGFRRAESISSAARIELEFAKNVLGIGSDTRDIPTA